MSKFGNCSVCGAWGKLNADGTKGKHTEYINGKWSKIWCKGWNKPARQDS